MGASEEIGRETASLERVPSQRDSDDSDEHPNLNPQLFVISSRQSKRDTERGGQRTHDVDQEETYPEGGREAWLVVLGSWFALVAALGTMNTIGTFQAYVSHDQLKDYKQSAIGWIFSIYSFLSFFLGIYIGPIFDKYGPRWLLIAGTCLLFAGGMLISVCTKFWHFILVFGIIQGAGTSLLFTPSIAAIGHFFKVRRGFSTGVASSGGGIGGIIIPLMLQRLFDQVGYMWGVRTYAFFCLFCGTVACFLVKSRLPPAENATPHPDFRIFKNVSFLLTTIAIFLFEFGLFVPVAYLSIYALDQGFSKSFSYQIITVSNAGSVVGRLLPGWYADIIGPYNADIISIVLTVIAIFGIWLPVGNTTPGIIIFAVLFGYGMGSLISLTPVCVGKLCKTQEYGRYYATCYTIVSISCLVGIPVAGSILAADGGKYWGLMVLTGAMYIGSGIFFQAVKVTRVGWNPWKRF